MDLRRISSNLAAAGMVSGDFNVCLMKWKLGGNHVDSGAVGDFQYWLQCRIDELSMSAGTRARGRQHEGEGEVEALLVGGVLPILGSGLRNLCW